MRFHVFAIFMSVIGFSFGYFFLAPFILQPPSIEEKAVEPPSHYETFCFEGNEFIRFKNHTNGSIAGPMGECDD